MNTGSRIKRLREQMNMSADELAEEIGKSRATVYRYENGHIDDIPMKTIERLAEVLATTPEYLMGWTDDPVDYEEAAQYDDIPLDLLDYFAGDPEAAVKAHRAMQEEAQREAGLTYSKRITTPSCEGMGGISLDETNAVLVEMGYIRKGEQLSDADFAFLTHIGGLMDAWFSSKHP